MNLTNTIDRQGDMVKSDHVEQYYADMASDVGWNSEVRLRWSTFVKLFNGELALVYSDNNEEQTLDIIPESQWLTPNGGYDVETISCRRVPYSDVAIIDKDLIAVKSFNLLD